MLAALLEHPDHTQVVLTNSLGDKVHRHLATLDLPKQVPVLGDTRQYAMDPGWGHHFPHLQLGDIQVWPLSERYQVDLRRPVYYEALARARGDGSQLAVVADTFSLPGALPLRMGIPFFVLCTSYTPDWCAEAVASHPFGRVLQDLSDLPAALDALPVPRPRDGVPCHIVTLGGVYIMRGKLKMAFGSTKTAQGTRTLPDQDDRRALEDAVDAYWARVCATLYRLVADWDDAEDLALEVFCRLYARPPRDRRGLGSWLYRVATNLGLNALRARQRRRRHEGTAEALKLQREDPVDPAREVERREEREQVRQVLAQMKPRAAKLLILRHSGLSYGEIADALSLAPGSVGTLLARAEKDFERCYRALEESNETP